MISVLPKLGATRLFERVDADLDYSATAEQWSRDIVAIVKEKAAQASPVVQSIATATTAPGSQRKPI